MDNHKKSDYISWTILIGLLLLVIEVTFFNKHLIFSLLFYGLLIYFGRKRLHQLIGKLMFGIGCFTMIFTTIDMIMFKFFILAVVVYVIIYFYKSKNRPLLIQPRLIEEAVGPKIKKTNSSFENILYGHQQTSNDIYEWHDINIQTGIGDFKIDVSNTVLPKGESIISVRNLIGNIQILVPYDLEVSVSHNVLSGTTVIFEATEEKLFNQQLVYRSEGYDDSFQKLKIITSLGIGRLEVKRT